MYLQVRLFDNGFHPRQEVEVVVVILENGPAGNTPIHDVVPGTWFVCSVSLTHGILKDAAEREGVTAGKRTCHFRQSDFGRGSLRPGQFFPAATELRSWEWFSAAGTIFSRGDRVAF